jgi:hypothetical protein
MMIDMKGLKNALKSKSVDDIKSIEAEVSKLSCNTHIMPQYQLLYHVVDTVFCCIVLCCVIQMHIIHDANEALDAKGLATSIRSVDNLDWSKSCKSYGFLSVLIAATGGTAVN